MLKMALMSLLILFKLPNLKCRICLSSTARLKARFGSGIKRALYKRPFCCLYKTSSLLHPHFNSLGAHEFFSLRHSVFAEVENARSQDRIRTAEGHPIH